MIFELFITSGELFKNLEDCLNDCLKILIDDEVKDFVAINFSEYFKPTREKLCSKLSDEKIMEKLLNCFMSQHLMKQKNMLR